MEERKSRTSVPLRCGLKLTRPRPCVCRQVSGAGSQRCLPTQLWGHPGTPAERSWGWAPCESRPDTYAGLRHRTPSCRVTAVPCHLRALLRPPCACCTHLPSPLPAFHPSLASARLPLSLHPLAQGLRRETHRSGLDIRSGSAAGAGLPVSGVRPGP